MAAKIKRGGLGKGLDALFADNETADAGTSTLRLSEIEPNSDQPRKHFDEEALSELADSIREHGVIQPLLVRPMAGGGYQLVAGERRWRASRMAGLTEVPVVISELDDEQVMAIALIENLQREDLNPMEEAMGYRNLMESYSLTQEQVAKKLGKSRPAVANALRLLNLPEEIQPLVVSGELSAGHARALLAFTDNEAMVSAAKLAAQGKLSVRDLEQMSKKAKKANDTSEDDSSKEVFGGESFFKEMELALQNELGKKIKITADSKTNTGKIEITFYSKEELSDIAERLSKA
ncbi:MAG: ParB/RepB/Spo0J family partition protein [Oscillospiraceae bacterium]|nr:ParB/RepB/Spo0J family partition protein [Oscillospiraceae bacterium]